MRERKRSVLLRPPALVVMVALLLAVSGVLYAHWTATLNLDGNVNTGGVGVGWFGAWTNDDGVDNGDGEPTDFEVYDAWGGDSSADPKGPGSTPDTARWDKDVAACYANAGGNHLNVQIEGAYPSYHCNLTALLAANGNVPVRATAFTFTGNKVWHDEDGQHETPLNIFFGPVEGNFAFGNETPEVEGDISLGVRCGTQLDPADCGWFLGAGTMYYGPVGYDEDGNFADLGGNDLQCNDGPTACWVHYPEGTEPDGNRSEGDLPVFENCRRAPVEVGGWLHVLQAADQNAQYQYTISQDFVNWNEFSYCMCTDGVPAADPDGTIIGVVDYSVERCLLTPTPPTTSPANES